MTPTPSEPTGAHRHVVLLGASNLAFGFPEVVRSLSAAMAGEPLTIWAARGCGRSYGQVAGVPGYRTPGVARCGLFDELETTIVESTGHTVHALVTDIGNDILYRAGVDQIREWVDVAVDRLIALGARIGVTSLPVESVHAMPAWKFRLIRPLLYPFRPIPQADVLRQVRETQEAISELGGQRGFQVLETQSAWYGFDHFHLRRAVRPAVFAEWLGAVLERDVPANNTPALGSRRAVRFHQPLEDYVLGRRRTKEQPGTEVLPGVQIRCY